MTVDTSKGELILTGLWVMYYLGSTLNALSGICSFLLSSELKRHTSNSSWISIVVRGYVQLYELYAPLLHRRVYFEYTQPTGVCLPA